VGGISFGLKTDGTIIAIGSNYYGCITKVKKWSNIQAIHMGPYGIDSDGNVFSAMHSTYGREPVNGWRDIVDISATYDYRVGLKSDGSLVFGLVNDLKRFANARTWTDIQIP
jgi:hypothetical protein